MKKFHGTKMQSIGPNQKAAAVSRPVPICPRCGSEAAERTTRYGIRSECCGLHSWDRGPLVDQATHNARRELASLLFSLKKSIGASRLSQELVRRTKLGAITVIDVKNMNEPTCRRVKQAADDILMDIMAGDMTVKA